MWNKTQCSVGRGVTLGAQSFSRCLSRAAGYRIPDTQREPRMSRAPLSQHPLWGCFSTSPPISCLASGDYRELPECWDLPKSFGTVRGSLGYVPKVASFCFRQLLHPLIWVLSSLSSVHNEPHSDCWFPSNPCLIYVFNALLVLSVLGTMLSTLQILMCLISITVLLSRYYYANFTRRKPRHGEVN